ncbi:hypothetical protein [Okeania sp. SIO2B3]|nr:hypothetical protein [Okeania sp. SIO2B3]
MAETPVFSEVGNSLFWSKRYLQKLKVESQKSEVRINDLNTSFE